MGDRLRVGRPTRTPPWYVTTPTRSTQPCIPSGSVNRSLALIGCCRAGISPLSGMTCEFPRRWGTFASCYAPFTLLHFYLQSAYRKSCSHARHPVPVLQTDSQKRGCTTCCRDVTAFELKTAVCRVPILGTSIKRPSKTSTSYSNRPNSPITICRAMDRSWSSRENKIVTRSSPAAFLSLISSSEMHGKQG